jgi:hypothetical protein
LNNGKNIQHKISVYNRRYTINNQKQKKKNKQRHLLVDVVKILNIANQLFCCLFNGQSKCLSNKLINTSYEYGMCLPHMWTLVKKKLELIENEFKNDAYFFNSQMWSYTFRNNKLNIGTLYDFLHFFIDKNLGWASKKYTIKLWIKHMQLFWTICKISPTDWIIVWQLLNENKWGQD